MSDDIYQFKITLQDVDPPVWRRIQVPEEYTFWDLHVAMQDAMGWQDYHLHGFSTGREFSHTKEVIGIPDTYTYGDSQNMPSWEVPITDLFIIPGSMINYRYDFGDCWDHQVLLEKVLDREEGQEYPVCIGGERACPPEDCGGSWGYRTFLEALADPSHERHDRFVEWIGGEFDPEEFDPDTVVFDDPEERWKNAFNISFPPRTIGDHLTKWESHTETEELNSWSEDIPVRRDMVTLLEFTRENKFRGTRSTGNMPLKMVRRVTAQFVDPPELDMKIGEREYKLRSEQDVWPLYFLHIIADIRSLIRIKCGKYWKVTTKGEKFLEIDPACQISVMLSTWWYEVDWLIRFPVEGMGERLPYEFHPDTLSLLLSYPADTEIEFKDFAERLINKTGLSWSNPESDLARELLELSINRMVITILKMFHIIEAEYQEVTGKGSTKKELTTFTITPYGKALLEFISA